jgi:hypothetical protein
MSNSIFTVGAPGIDVDKIVADINKSVAQKMKDGIYTDPRIARAERTNMANLKNEEDFLAFYLDCLRDAVIIDISDFDIRERRSTFPAILKAVKKGIWKLLKFYTYRLWSQQNQTNALLLSAIEGIESRYKDKIRNLEERIAKIEGKTPNK